MKNKQSVPKFSNTAGVSKMADGVAGYDAGAGRKFAACTYARVHCLPHSDRCEGLAQRRQIQGAIHFEIGAAARIQRNTTHRGAVRSLAHTATVKGAGAGSGKRPVSSSGLTELAPCFIRVPGPLSLPLCRAHVQWSWESPRKQRFYHSSIPCSPWN
jgi:hypothetical protein